MAIFQPMIEQVQNIVCLYSIYRICCVKTTTYNVRLTFLRAAFNKSFCTQHILYVFKISKYILNIINHELKKGPYL